MFLQFGFRKCFNNAQGNARESAELCFRFLPYSWLSDATQEIVTRVGQAGY